MDGAEVSRYLERARALGVVPNFWLTQEYLNIQDAELEQNGKVMWIQEDDWAVFPPLPIYYDSAGEEDCPWLRVWSDFQNLKMGKQMEFLDWEYTYDSNNFNNMVGQKWAVFRKNSRKWPRGRGWTYKQHPAPNSCVERLVMKWLEGKPSAEEIQDEESMIWFLFNGSRRAFLFEGDELKGVNVWDSNEPYLMYRYCVTDPEEPFLNEFCRLLFYQSVPGRLVIDGGSLGNPGLERFKDKLNPIKKRPVYSRAINGGG